VGVNDDDAKILFHGGVDDREHRAAAPGGTARGVVHISVLPERNDVADKENRPRPYLDVADEAEDDVLASAWGEHDVVELLSLPERDSKLNLTHLAQTSGVQR
jgi:hypothetical protein